MTRPSIKPALADLAAVANPAEGSEVDDNAAARRAQKRSTEMAGAAPALADSYDDASSVDGSQCSADEGADGGCVRRSKRRRV